MTKKNKQVETELIKTTSEETDQVKTFVFILIGVALVAAILYFVSTQYLVKDGVKKDTTPVAEEISYNNVNVGTVFNRPEEEYYVMAYDPDSPKASFYSTVMSLYKDDKIRLYFLNLSIEANKAYVKETSNPNATKASELALNTPTLIKIKNGKIDKYIEDYEEIKKELKID